MTEVRRWLVLVVALALVVGAAGGVAASSLTRSLTVRYSDIKLSVDGKVIDTGSSEAFVVVDEGRTYVPARYLAEALGAKVTWDAATSTVVATTPNYVSFKAVTGGVLAEVPYYGLSLQLPEGSKLEPKQENLLFLATSPKGVYGLAGLPAPDAEITIQQYWNGMKATLAGFQFGELKPVSVPGAVQAYEATGTGKSNGVSMNVTIRLVVTPEQTWMIEGLGAVFDYDQQAIDQVINTFKFSK